jgi:hypothetical protein
MIQGSRRTLVLIIFLFASSMTAGAAVEHASPQLKLKPKSASACTRYADAIATSNGCTFGSEVCYVCDYTNQYGTYECYEAPNPADATYCNSIDTQNYG